MRKPVLSTPYTRKLSNERRDKGLCLRCGVPSEGKIRCTPCSDEVLVNTMRWQDRVKEAVFLAYGGYHCNECGITDPDILTIDHVAGKKAHGHADTFCGVPFYRWLQKSGFPKGFQVLCMNCNYKKMMVERRSKSKIRAMIAKSIPSPVGVN